MHTHTIRTKYALGDRVRFYSKSQGGGGIGTIQGIAFDVSGQYYMIDLDGEMDTWGGILEEEIAPLADGARS